MPPLGVNHKSGSDRYQRYAKSPMNSADYIIRRGVKPVQILAAQRLIGSPQSCPSWRSVLRHPSLSGIAEMEAAITQRENVEPFRPKVVA